MKKILVLLLCAALLLSGCNSEQLTSLLSGSGAGSGSGNGDYDGRIGDTLTNAFFSYSVDKARLADSYESLYPPRGYSYLVATITVKNVFGEAIPMFSSDFQVQWGEGDDDYDYPIDKISEKQMDDEYSLKKAERITAECVYEVPTPTKSTEYSISYLEIYDDDSTGDVFFVYFDLKP